MSSITLRNVKGAALTFTELDDNFSNLNTDKLESVVADTSPQLGGNLDVNGNSIVSASAGNIDITPDTTGSIVLDGLSWPQADGTTGQYLKTDGAGNLSWDDPDTDTNTTYNISAETGTGGVNLRLSGSDASTDDVLLQEGANITLTRTDANTITIESASGSGGISNLVEDTTPELGGDLDVGDFALVTTGLSNEVRIEPGTNKNIALNVAGTGEIYLNWATWPGTDGTTSQVLQTNGAGALTWTDAGITSVLDDTAPELGGDLTCGDFKIQAPVLEDYAETVYSLGSTDTPTLTVSNGNVQTVSITSGLTLPEFTDPATGQSMTLLVSGSGTVTGGVNHKFAGGNTTLTTDSVISIFYDGTTYWTSVATDFQ